MSPERYVLHVLPHPGGGGETYVDLLDEMSGYRFERMFLASSPSATPPEIVRGLAGVARGVGGVNLLHVHGEVAGALCLPLLATRPSIVTLHGLHLVRRLSGSRRMAAVLNLRAILRVADRTICVSESEHAELIRVVGTATARGAVVIRNGVRLPLPASGSERLSLRESLGIGPSDPVAIWVGSLDERKNPLDAVRAAERASITLLVVGDGPLRRQVERRASRNTHVLGHRNDVSHLLAASDIFLLTSQREGLSFSVLEAMAHGLVSVVMDVPENMEAVGDTGIGVPPDNECLAEELCRLAANPLERADRGARALRRVSRLFNASDMRQRTRALYNDALAPDRITAS